jgi:hypothetical protein
MDGAMAKMRNDPVIARLVLIHILSFVLLLLNVFSRILSISAHGISFGFPISFSVMHERRKRSKNVFISDNHDYLR